MQPTTWGDDPIIFGFRDWFGAWYSTSFFHTYLYCIHIVVFGVLAYFSRFSAIQNKTFLRIGASPRLGQHKELLVHEEEDSRHLGERIKFEGISGQNPATNVPTYAHPWEPPLKKEVGIL